MLRFESLEDRRMLSAAWQSDNGDGTFTNPVLYADDSDPDVVRVDECAGEAGALQADGLALVADNVETTAVSAIVAADSLASDVAEALVTVPRGRPTLNADGTTFVADNGSLLRGPFASTEWGNPPPLSAIQSIKDLGANAIHLYGEVFDPNYVTGVPGSGTAPGYSASRIDQMVQMTRDEGLYLILTIGNGGNNGSFNYDYVTDFWEFYAPRYKDETHVIFEIQNEPHAWSAPYPQAALDMEADAYNLIRSLAPDTPVLLFSFAVLGSGSAAVNDAASVSAAAPIDWSNAAVAFHGYAGYEATTASVEYILAHGYPVFMTEFAGGQWGTNTGGLDVEMTAELERLEVSWLTFQHIPPNFISSDFTDPEAFYDVVNNAGLSWVPDFGTWPAERGVYSNDGQPWETTGLSGTLRIQAENFDTGANGVAYSDSDSANLGGQLRPGDGVDIEATADVGGGYDVGWTAGGEWLEYTVFVTEPGLYNLRLRVASPSAGAARVVLNGKDKTGEWDLPNTGGSQSWTTVTQQVFLEFGRQKLRFEILAGGFSLNWIELAPISSGPIANGTYKIVNRNSALIAEADTTNQQVVQNPYTGASNERWNLVHRGAGQYSITSASDGWSWSTFYHSNGEPLSLAPWGYDGNAGRRFIIVPADNGYFEILVAGGGLSIEIENASMTSGAAAEQYVYQGESHQQWGVLSPSAPTMPTGLTATWSTETAVLGDCNQDGTVDAADYTVWRDHLNDRLTPGTGADGTGNGVVDDEDFQLWKTNFGNTTLSSRVELSWTATSGALSYNIERASTSGGPYTTIATGVIGTLFSDPVPDQGTYFYVVTAVGAAGESLVSNEAAPPTLHAYLKFDEGSGTSAADSTDNGWNGVLVSGAQWAPGIDGTAVQLDGSNDYVSLPAGVVNGLTEATLAGWVYLDSTSTWSRVFDFGTSTSDYMFLTGRASSGNVRFAITTGSGEQQINGDAPIPTGQWTHFAVTLREGLGILYINGVEVGRNSSMTLSPASLGVTTHNYIGKSQFTWDPYLDGILDDFRIYADALSAAEVQALATPPALAALVTDSDQSVAAPLSLLSATADTVETAATPAGADLPAPWQLDVAHAESGLSRARSASPPARQPRRAVPDDLQQRIALELARRLSATTGGEAARWRTADAGAPPLNALDAASNGLHADPTHGLDDWLDELAVDVASR